MFATGALGAVTLVTFALVEREAAEPVLPPALWRERVFVMAGALSLIVGFALFGAVTFLPPEAVAVLVPTPRPCSIHNPTAITAVPTTGNALYVRRDADAGDRRLGRYGGVRLDLHQPADRSAERRRAAAALERIVAGGGRLTGEQVLRPPAGERLAYQEAYVHALTPVFAVAAGVALVGFAVSWLLPERPLRATAATSRGLEDSLAAPRSPVSLAEVERALSLCTSGEERSASTARWPGAPAST